MPTRWETFPLELTGGLVSNMSRLQQGLKQPGSARVLLNFEPSVKGGYRRINGFTKYDDEIVPPYGSVLVQGSGQTGTSLVVSNVHETPVANDTLTISGVTGTYTVSGVSYSDTNKEATLTITPALDSSPADQAAVTFVSGQSLIEGVYFGSSNNSAFVLRGGSVWRSTGSGWSLVSVPDYGTPLVNSGAATGTSLPIDGIDSDSYVPQVGDTFTVAGIEKVYTVLSEPTVTSGAGTLTIYPALASTPADNAAVTFLSSSHTGGTKARFEAFNFDGTFKIVMVDQLNNPVVFTTTTYKTLQGSTDITGAQFVAEFKDHLFFAKDDLVSFSSPFLEEDYTPANGAGSYRIHPSNCTGLIVFREQLINFSEEDIRKLTGTSVADFALTAITNDLGCVRPDTIQEVGGDVLFLGPDGVRFLGATERIGDFNLSLASRQIQDNMVEFIVPTSEYCSVKVREKNQYRIFNYVAAGLKENAQGYLGSQFLDQNAQSINWGETRGIKAYRAHSAYTTVEEVVIFSNEDDYLYRMESGSTYDGAAITSFFYTPFMAVNDPSIRKTAYKIDTYFDPEGDLVGTLTPKYDFNKPSKIQPNSVGLDGGGSFAIYGEAVYGESLFGGNPETTLETNVTGSFFTVSLQYEFEGGSPFVLDTVLLEYSTEDRK